MLDSISIESTEEEIIKFLKDREVDSFEKIKFELPKINEFTLKILNGNYDISRDEIGPLIANLNRVGNLDSNFNGREY